MKKVMIRIKLVVLIVILGVAVSACDEKGENDKGLKIAEAKQKFADIPDVEDSSEGYKADHVKQKLIEMFDIDESEIRVQDSKFSPKGIIISYFSMDVGFDCYILKGSDDRLQSFNNETMGATYEKRVDEEEHKIWVAEYKSDFDNSISYALVALKDNLVFSITSEAEHDILIDVFDLN